MAEADWAGLHGEILVSILQKVRLIEDFVAFGSVCKSWWEASRNKQRYLRPQIPWLMLPDRDNRRQIYSIERDDLLRGSLCVPEMSDRKCIGLNYGWILTVSRKGDMNLLHPLSGSQIPLPSQRSLDYYQQHKCRPSYCTTSLAALSANPSESAEDFVVMIAYGGFLALYLSYWRPGAQRWTRVTNQGFYHYSDLIHYQDRFYALDYCGRVLICCVSDLQDGTMEVDLGALFHKGYIVESNGNLLLVVRAFEQVEVEEETVQEVEIVENSEGEEEVSRVFAAKARNWTFKFKVYKLDLINEDGEHINSLGDCAIFLGHNTSVSLDSSKFPGLFRPNHIYFTDDCAEDYAQAKKGGGRDMGSYNLEDGQVTRFNVGEDSYSRINPPFWFIPSLT